MKRNLLSVLIGATLASPIAVMAGAGDPGFHFIVSGGLTHGGGRIDTVYYTNGNSENIRAGSLAHFGGGVLWQAVDVPFATSLTANYHFDNASGRNGDVTFDRIPLELITYYTGVQSWRLGAGLRFVQAAQYTYDVGTTYKKVKFKDTTGALVEVGYGFTPSMWLNVRYVSERYKPKSASMNGLSAPVTSSSIDASHIGVNFLFQF